MIDVSWFISMYFDGVMYFSGLFLFLCKRKIFVTIFIKFLSEMHARV